MEEFLKSHEPRSLISHDIRDLWDWDWDLTGIPYLKPPQSSTLPSRLPNKDSEVSKVRTEEWACHRSQTLSLIIILWTYEPTITCTTITQPKVVN